MTVRAIAWMPIVIGFALACSFLFIQAAHATEEVVGTETEISANVKPAALTGADEGVVRSGVVDVAPARVEAGATMARFADVESNAIGMVAIGCTALLALAVTGGLVVSRRD